MELFGLTPWEWVLPVLIGIVAGLFTNAIAIWMLFHPYEPVRIGPVRILPMGAIPKEIDRIARRIGETVGRELLTPGDIASALSAESFRQRFDAALRSALSGLLDRELGPLRELVSAPQAAELEQLLLRLLEKAIEGVQVYLESPEWEARVHSFAQGLGGEFRERPFSVVLTPELRRDLERGLAELWAGVRESPGFSRAIADSLDRALSRLLVSEKPVRHYVPAGAVNLGEAVVNNYLPIVLDRFGGILEEPATREKLQQALRRFADRFLDAQQSWKRLVGRLVITERTLAQTVEAIEEGGVEEISALLREPEVQRQISQALNEGVEELLDRPVRELLGEVSPERAVRLRNALVERVLYLFRHPTTETVVLSRVHQLIEAVADRTVGELLDFFGEEHAQELIDRGAEWIVETTRGPRAGAFLRSAIENRTEWILSVPIGRLADYLPENAVRRAEVLLADPLWDFLQSRVPRAIADLPIAQVVEEKLRNYPISKVEELIWRVSQRELVLIIYLGGFLGALIGSLMLLLQSLPAGLVASGFFLLLSFLFINLKG